MAEDFRVAQPRTAAGLLIRNPDGHVLLVKPTYKSGWDLPGGYVEPGESPRDAAVRELREELAASTEIGRLLVVDWAPHPDEGDKLLFVFDGGYLDLEALQADGDEIGEIAYVAPAELRDYLPGRLLTRVTSALDDDPNPYREHGQPAG